MPADNNKITIRQLLIMFIISTLSPAIRLYPTQCCRIAGVAGWISPIISSFALFLLLAVLGVFFKNNAYPSLNEVYTAVLGKIATKILLVIYLFWVSNLYFLYIRYYAERLLSSIYPNTDIRFFLVSILIIVYIAARGKIESFARFAEISLLIFTFVFIMFYIFLISSTKITNLLPITPYDIIPAFKGTSPTLAIWGYVILFFIFGDCVSNKNEIKKYRKNMLLYITIMTTLMMIFVIGSLGYKTVQRMSLPFFNAVKEVSFMQTFDRTEALLLSVWVMSDFVLITSFTLMIMAITKKLFNGSEIKYCAAPVVLLGYAGSQFIATNRYELEFYTNIVGIPANLIICYGIPLAVFLIGKIRKKI